MAQRGGDREELRRELIRQLDARLKQMREQMVREIDRKLGAKAAPRRTPRKKAAPKRGGKPFLGVALKDLRPGLRELLGIPGKGGVLIDRIARNSSAARAGLRRTDVIVRWGDHAVNGKQQLIELISKVRVGDRVKIVIFRRGKKLDVSVTISARPSEGAMERDTYIPKRGARPDRGEQDLERFLDKALQKRGKGERGTKRPRPQNQDMRKMLEDMMGPGGDERVKKMMEQFFGGKGGDYQEMLERGMKMYQEMNKNPESRKKLEDMMKQFFGGQGAPNEKELQKYLDQMMRGQGNPKAQPNGSKRVKPTDEKDSRKRINKMLDDLLGDGKKSTRKPKVVRKRTGKRGYLGVGLTPLTETLRHQLSLPEGTGVLVSQVVKGSPAASAGLRQYDVILSMGDAKIASLSDVRKVLGQVAPGAKVTAQVLRGGKKRKITVVLGAPPKQGFK